MQTEKSQEHLLHTEVISIKILCAGSKVFAFFGISSGSSLFAKILVYGFQCAEAL